MVCGESLGKIVTPRFDAKLFVVLENMLLFMKVVLFLWTKMVLIIRRLIITQMVLL